MYGNNRESGPTPLVPGLTEPEYHLRLKVAFAGCSPEADAGACGVGTEQASASAYLHGRTNRLTENGLNKAYDPVSGCQAILSSRLCPGCPTVVSSP